MVYFISLILSLQMTQSEQSALLHQYFHHCVKRTVLLNNGTRIAL